MLPDEVSRRPVSAADTTTANRRWWDSAAAGYLEEHGRFLGDAALVWGPEGWAETELRVLGPAGSLRGRTVLEFGAGAAQAARWCAAEGARVVASDLSAGMLRAARVVEARHPGPHPALVQADATRLPFADRSFDVVFSAYGAVPFVADSAALMKELARLLVAGGRLALSTTHPVRWAFPDAPGPEGLTASSGYFDETPYVEQTDGEISYVEHHRTLEHRVGELLDAGLRLVALREPPWRPTNQETWGGWSPLRGHHLPGTLVLVAERPA